MPCTYGHMHVHMLFQRWVSCRDVDAISRLTMQLPLQQTLIPTSNCKSLGLSYHLADVWLDELKNVADEQAVPQQALLLLLEPFFAVLESSGEQPLLARIK